jgi:hypothetical protein
VAQDWGPVAAFCEYSRPNKPASSIKYEEILHQLIHYQLVKIVKRTVLHGVNLFI